MFRDFSLLVMWIGLVCSENALTTSSTSPLKDHVFISSNVDTVQTGLTKSMTLNCSIPPPSGSDYVQLVSLMVSKNNSATNELEEIASINSFAPGVINTLQPTSATISALLTSTGTSYLQLQWKYPQKSDTGFYQCECTVLDDVGHPVTLTSGKDIKHAEPTLTALVEKFRVLEMQLDDLRDRVSLATGSMFYSTNVINGWRYHFSKFAYGDVDKAEAACNLVNGHLVDFENKAEFDLVNFIIKSNLLSSPSGSWLIGLSDEATEGTWLVRYSGQPAGYILWYGDHALPMGTGAEDCSSFKSNGHMYSVHCTSTEDTPFICKSRDL